MEAKDVFEHESDHLLASVYSLKVIYDLRVLNYLFTLIRFSPTSSLFRCQLPSPGLCQVPELFPFIPNVI